VSSDSVVPIAHLVSHPIQYFAPLYRELAARPEIDLTVYFYSDATVREFQDPGFGRAIAWDTPLLDGYEHRFLPSASHTGISGGFLRKPNWDIVQEVRDGGYDVLWVHGYAHLTTWLAVAAARSAGIRVLIRDEQTLLHGRPPHKQALKEVALRALYSQSSALYIGDQNRRYFAHYGMPEERMWPARYCVDNAAWQRRAAELAPSRDEIRASFGIDDGAPVVLFSGKLIEKKQPLRLIEAFAAVRARQRCHLLIAGDGPLRQNALALISRLGVRDVHLAGFLNQSELARAYAAADLFVLPSKLHETWGLVVNEAMNFGLPVIVSDKVGCAIDPVHEGRNGFIAPHEDSRALSRHIATLVDDPAMRQRFGEESKRIVAAYSIQAAVDGIVDACLERRARDSASPSLDRATAAA
jgi:glycosyltransferase involved in cell wall biosynthesis